MPITPDRTVTGALVAHYFDNLLPDDERIRRRIATRFKTDSTEAFELLQAIGRDCVGAVQLLPADTEPDGFDQVDGEPMSDADIEKHLQGAVTEPAPVGRTMRVASASPSPARRKKPRCCVSTANGAAP